MGYLFYINHMVMIYIARHNTGSKRLPSDTETTLLEKRERARCSKMRRQAREKLSEAGKKGRGDARIWTGLDPSGALKDHGEDEL
jgi:hypothetical protein